MAFGVDATSHATATGTDGTGLTWAHTCGASANKLVALVGGGVSVGSKEISSMTYNGIAFTGEAVDGNNASWAGTAIWYLDNPTADGNPHNIVATWAATQSQRAGAAISFNEAATGVAATGTNTGTSANPSVTVASSQSADIVVSVVFSDSGPNATMDENGTLIAEDENVESDSDYNAQRQTASGASTVCSWTCSDSGDPWGACALAVRAAAGGGGTGPTPVQAPIVLLM